MKIKQFLGLMLLAYSKTAIPLVSYSFSPDSMMSRLLSTGGAGWAVLGLRDRAAPLFQMLWGRLDIQANGTVRLRDEELASLRPARRFLRILEEEVPKTPTEIEQHLRYYSLTDTPLSPTEFDRLLFTGVYSAYQVRSMQGLDKTPWIGFFSQLVDEIFRDLCKGLCPEYHYFTERHH
uniref:F180B protein n=1 Tax=Zosterops lateralis melanops TaxID=1220523 RepID=A0A8D2P9A4_ZOSLA